MKTLSDPVYGTIQMTDLEIRVLDTPTFQRLRRVSQLGLTELVFPSAGFSRFTHSIGVCHLTGLMLNYLAKNSDSFKITDQELQLYRLAGLLHDLGHYPYSHIVEHATKQAYTERFVLKAPGAAANTDSDSSYLSHERLSFDVAKLDPQIHRVLSSANVDASDIWAIIWGEDRFHTGDKRPVPIRNLISADMDADRLDYMLRTNHHSGIPYGFVDLDYLLTQLRYHPDRRIFTLGPKALAAADHMLVNRFFNYQQIAFNKSVAGLELALEHLLLFMLGTDRMDLTPNTLKAMIGAGRWCEYDENWMRSKMELVLRDEVRGTVPSDLARAVLDRHPLKLLQEHLRFSKIETTSEKEYAAKLLQVRMALPRVAKGLRIEPERLLVWGRQIKLTKVPSSVEVTLVGDEDVMDSSRLDAIQISNSSGDATPIVTHRHSLMQVLSQFAWESIRVYMLPKSTWTPRTLDSRVTAGSRAVLDALPAADFGDGT